LLLLKLDQLQHIINSLLFLLMVKMEKLNLNKELMSMLKNSQNYAQIIVIFRVFVIHILDNVNVI